MECYIWLLFVVFFVDIFRCSSQRDCCGIFNLTCTNDSICEDHADIFGRYERTETSGTCFGYPYFDIFTHLTPNKTYYIYSDLYHECNNKPKTIDSCEWVISDVFPDYYCSDDIYLHSWRSDDHWGAYCPEEYDTWRHKTSVYPGVRAECIHETTTPTTTSTPPNRTCCESIKVVCSPGACCGTGIYDWAFFGIYENKGYHIYDGEISY